jgi:hypothetical protein
MSTIRGWSNWVVKAGEQTAGVKGVGDFEHSTVQASRGWQEKSEEPSPEAMPILIRPEPRGAMVAVAVRWVPDVFGSPPPSLLSKAIPTKSLRGNLGLPGFFERVFLF